MKRMAVQTKVVRVRADQPEPDAIAQAAAVLRCGGLVAFPTETVYGLGADALNAAAVARIFAAKGRPANNPLIVHVAGIAEARVIVADWPGTAARLTAHFWPGPLTLVLRRGPSVPDVVTAGGPTVAVRLPAHAVAQALIAAAGAPLAAPSANRSFQLSPTHAEHVLRDLDGRIDLILDGGPTTGGIESTVIDVTRTPPRLLRPGPISPREIESILGHLDLISPPAMGAEPALPAPGMMARHYAPRAPLELAIADGWRCVETHARAGRHVGWLTFHAAPEQRHALVTAVVMPFDATAYAAQLYAVLHSLDDAGVERIVVALPPDAEDWLAVRDRLGRAASAT